MKLDHPPHSTTEDIDHHLFAAALTNATRRPQALAHLRDILAAGHHPDQIYQENGSSNAMLACATHGWVEAVDLLLAAGANIRANHDVALRYAAANGHLPVVERLLAAGADPKAMNSEALISAIKYGGSLLLVERLLAAGADIHANNNKALYEALFATVFGKRTVVVERLLAAGASAVQVVRTCPDETKQVICRALNALATAIPANQRQQLVADACWFPAFAALAAAEQRQAATRCATPRRRDATP